jgi:hypothetical protein
MHEKMSRRSRADACCAGPVGVQLLQLRTCAFGVSYTSPNSVVDACAATPASAACASGAVFRKCEGRLSQFRQRALWLLGRGATLASAASAATSVHIHIAPAAVQSLHDGAHSFRRSPTCIAHMHHSFANTACYTVDCARRSRTCRRTCAPGRGRASRRRSSRASARPLSSST